METNQNENLSEEEATITKEKNQIKNDESQEEKQTKAQAIRKEIFSWIRVIVFALLLTFVLNRYVVFNFTVPTESMENTIMTDNRILSLRCAYWFSDPKRGDIVVFPFPDDPSETYIKRIIGLPNETIEGKDGYVYIDGKKFEEDYVTSLLDEDFGPYQIPEDSYFVMGDNRDISLDARYWENKFVKKEDIISKAVLRFYPNVKVLK